MKKTVFIQMIPHYPTSWGDATTSWNLAAFVKGLGTWLLRAYTQKLKFWTRQNFNIILDIDPNKPSQIILKNYMAGSSMVKVIDMQVAFDYLDKEDEDTFSRTCAFGIFFDPGQTDFSTNTIIKKSEWFYRPPHHICIKKDTDIEQAITTKFKSIETQKDIGEDSNLNCLVWFFVYRATDLPIYYIIPNPDLLGVAFNFNNIENADVRYMTVDPHFGTIGDLIFRPTFSNNVVLMTPEKIVAGQTFHMEPFKGGVFEWKFKENIPKMPIKIFSDIEYKQEEHTNKIIFNFKEGQERGYVHMRWNSNSLLDLSMSSRSFNNLQNKCNITLDVYRNDRHKYREGE